MYKYLLLSLLLPLLSFTLHKEYYSLTKIEYNSKEQTLQITMRLFADDMDKALSDEFKKNVELGTDREVKEIDKLLTLYLEERFGLYIDDTKYPTTFIGKEFEKNEVFLYLEIPNIKSIAKIEVRNTILIDTFEEQENIIKVRYLNQNKSLILNSNHEKGQLQFE